MASPTFRNSTLFKLSNLQKTDLACKSYLTLRRRKAIMRAISPKAALMTVSRCAGWLWTHEGCTLSHSWLSSTNTVDVTQTEWRKPHFQVKMFCCLWSLSVVPLCVLFMILLLATSSHEGKSERAEPQLKDQQILVATQVTVLMQIYFLVHFDHRFSSDCLKSI